MKTFQNLRDSFPVETADWGTSNRLGREFADKIVALMREEQCPLWLGNIVKLILERGHYGGVEVGFFHRISEYQLRC